MSSENETVAVKIEYVDEEHGAKIEAKKDVDEFRMEIIRKVSECQRKFDGILAEMDTDIDEIFKMLDAYPDREAMRGKIPPNLSVGMCFKRKANRGIYPATLVATFWNQAKFENPENNQGQ